MPNRFVDSINMSNTNITNLATPVAGTDAVTKDYVDASTRNLDFKVSVRAASLANINLAAPGTTIDGVTMAVTTPRQSFFAGGQTAGAENGLYDYNGAAVAATRRADADSNAEVTSGMQFAVEEGTANGNKEYRLITPNPITLGTTALTFSVVGGSSAAYTGSDTITISGNVVSLKRKASGGLSEDANGAFVDPAIVARRYDADVPGNGSLTSFVMTHNLGKLSVLSGLFDIASGARIEISVSARTINSETLTFATPPTAAQYRYVAIG